MSKVFESDAKISRRNWPKLTVIGATLQIHVDFQNILLISFLNSNIFMTHSQGWPSYKLSNE